MNTPIIYEASTALGHYLLKDGKRNFQLYWENTMQREGGERTGGEYEGVVIDKLAEEGNKEPRGCHACKKWMCGLSRLGPRETSQKERNFAM